MNDWLSDMQEKQKRTLESLRAGNCGCHRCLEERDEIRVHMIVCPTCGNKRCPKASDHELACTNSNEPGQAGSVYA